MPGRPPHRSEPRDSPWAHMLNPIGVLFFLLLTSTNRTSFFIFLFWYIIRLIASKIVQSPTDRTAPLA